MDLPEYHSRSHQCWKWLRQKYRLDYEEQCSGQGEALALAKKNWMPFH